MQGKKLILGTSFFILLVGAAAFLAGILLNQRVGPLSFGRLFEGKNLRSIIIPAPELPSTQPDVIGAFMEQIDNTITVEVRFLEPGGSMAVSKTGNQSGPLAEVVITGETIIYRETTQPDQPFSAENQTVRQTVEPAALDDLDSHSMLTVWGRKSGDRIVAEVLLYSDMPEIKRAIFEDCEICP
jgi:hypothetical protein